MKISFVIPAYNEEKNIGRCLGSIAAQIEKPDEIIVVDNNCTDRTVEIAETFGARIVKEKNQGMIWARNAGFNAALYEIIARTDADAILPPDWISKIKKNFEDPDLGGLSGPASYFDNSLMSRTSNFIAFVFFGTVGFLIGHPSMFGPNMAIRKSMWEKVKGNVCSKDCDVHEDIDLSIHLGQISKIKFDKNLSIRTTRGRWSKLLTEYVVRLTKMLASHRKIYRHK